MKCTNHLIQDHKIILRALNVLQEMAARVENKRFIANDDVETIVRFLHAFADDYHQGKEESALFPELMRTSAANGGPLRHMIFEHGQERSLVRKLEDAVRTKKGTQFVDCATRLISLIRTHIQKEDNVLFEIADGLLSADQDARVSAELESFHIDSSYLADLRRLESFYICKAEVA